MLRRQKGQALLIVVLVMVVALTVGLSVASRSITNLKTSRDQASSQKALSAAEAGIERVLANPGLGNISNAIGSSQDQINYTTTVSQASGINNFLLNGGYAISKNDHVSIWPSKVSDTNLFGANPAWSGQITLYWGSDANNTCSNAGLTSNAALEVSIISGDKNNPTLQRFAYDPCINRATQNGFDHANIVKQQTVIGSNSLQYSVNIPLVGTISNVYLISISPLYADNVYIGASASVSLPPQGANISSTGTVNSQVERKIAAFKDLPQIPAELFPYAIFSP